MRLKRKKQDCPAKHIVYHRVSIPHELRRPFSFGYVKDVVDQLTEARQDVQDEIVSIQSIQFASATFSVCNNILKRKLDLLTELANLDARIYEYKCYLLTVLPPIKE